MCPYLFVRQSECVCINEVRTVKENIPTAGTFLTQKFIRVVLAKRRRSNPCPFFSTMNDKKCQRERRLRADGRLQRDI